MLDRFDLALLNLLQADALATAETLGAEVALSPSAITRRLRRLRDSGVIARSVAILSPKLTDRRLRAIVQVQLHEHAAQKGLADLRQRLLDSPEVQLCLEVSGTFDLLLLIVSSDMTAFNAFADAQLAADESVRRYETSFVKKEIKNQPAVPLNERDLGEYSG